MTEIDYTHLIGRTVEIRWMYDDYPQSACGVLDGIEEIGGEKWASLDWGFGVDLSADGFSMSDWSPDAG